MKKIILGMVAAFALVSFLAPIARAEEAAAGGDKGEKTEKKAKKGGKKEKKGEGEKAADAPAK
jgi:hypothetical protein